MYITKGSGSVALKTILGAICFLLFRLTSPAMLRSMFSERLSNQSEGLVLVLQGVNHCEVSQSGHQSEEFAVKLIQRGFPLFFLNILIYWYSNLSSMVKWNGAFSRSFRSFQGYDKAVY